MRAVLQRVSEAKVVVEDVCIGEIQKGIVALIGIAETDTEKTMSYILDKIVQLRIFEDEAEKMNLSLQDIQGELLLIPNFTLYGDARKGRRPSYTSGASPAIAHELFQQFSNMAKTYPLPNIAFGQFQADMKVSILNDGPVTLLLDSEKIF